MGRAAQAFGGPSSQVKQAEKQARHTRELPGDQVYLKPASHETGSSLLAQTRTLVGRHHHGT